jgi:hypothetical protein
MSKKINCVKEMVLSAMRNGEAHITRNGYHVYEAYKANDTLTVVHYGTVILKFDLDFEKIISWGGWSNSDRDALNTILEYCVAAAPGCGGYFRILHGCLELIAC